MKRVEFAVEKVCSNSFLSLVLVSTSNIYIIFIYIIYNIIYFIYIIILLIYYIYIIFILLLVLLINGYTGNFLLSIFENIYIFLIFVYIYNIEKNLKIKFGFKNIFLYICLKEEKIKIFLILIYFFQF